MTKKPKKLTYSKAKKQALAAFSIYIRSRYANDQGVVPCFTCGTPKHWKELQAGHWIPGRHMSVLFDEQNCHQQCYHCNVGLKGNPIEYHAAMDKRYGLEVMADLVRLDKTTRKYKVSELVELKNKYIELLERLST